MLLTITLSAPDAGDLGYLLHKHPAKAQTFELSVGAAHVFYPHVADTRCTAALLLEVDPVGLVRTKRFGGDPASLGHYVNDRPYASSSMLAVAIGQVFSTAMTGRCDARPALAAAAIPLQLTLTAVPTRRAAGNGGSSLAARLFEPLGWTVSEQVAPLDPQFPDWGDSRYANLTLTGTIRLADALRQVYVLLPVLDDAKHYWVSDDEVDKLLRAGEGWLPAHPERELITRRYLAHQRSLVADATSRFAGEEVGESADADAPAVTPPSLAAARAEAVLAALHDVHAHRVADVGCGEGALLQRLLADAAFTEILGTDVSARALDSAAARLHLSDLAGPQRERIRLVQSSLTYTDERLAGLDAIVLMEVIEHIDLERHDALAEVVFGHARPEAVIVTTPNADYNARYPALAAGALRHPDHRFEWTRAEFAAWAGGIARRFGFAVEHRAVGDEDAQLGAPTQLALFRRVAA